MDVFHEKTGSHRSVRAIAAFPCSFCAGRRDEP
jgi:hypothetical protein